MTAVERVAAALHARESIREHFGEQPAEGCPVCLARARTAVDAAGMVLTERQRATFAEVVRQALAAPAFVGASPKLVATTDGQAATFRDAIARDVGADLDDERDAAIVAVTIYRVLLVAGSAFNIDDDGTVTLDIDTFTTRVAAACRAITMASAQPHRHLAEL